MRVKLFKRQIIPKAQFSVELEDEVLSEDDYSYSFSYSYDGIRSNCSEVSTFTYKLPQISVVNLSDNDPFAPGEVLDK